MSRPLRFLQAREFIFIKGQAADLAVEVFLLIEEGIDGLFPLRRSYQKFSHLFGHLTAGQPHSDAAFNAEKVVANGFVGQDFKALKVLKSHGENLIVGLTVQPVPPQVGRFFLKVFIAVR